MKHMEDFGYAHVQTAQTPAERERAMWQMGYTAGRTDERMRQWRAQDNGSASEETELSPSALVVNAGEV